MACEFCGGDGLVVKLLKHEICKLCLDKAMPAIQAHFDRIKSMKEHPVAKAVRKRAVARKSAWKDFGQGE